ncbi:hypothetical protein [uncultured Pseudoteredinibacter sp.]|uniref:hypothetical protein n=1 Tax=uncultured Pseudoteredinibacter sp. TaxID=1641701 RepID=UPI00260B6FF6|nr:hypothetical protein [uncultured Pseudoteredinibacter sp.]
MDVIRETTASSQHTAKQYFAAPAQNLGGLNLKWLKLSLFLLLLGMVASVSFYLASQQKVFSYPRVPAIDQRAGLAKSEEKHDTEADLIGSLQGLPATASHSASVSPTHRDLLDEVHSYNQSYKLIEEVELVLPETNNTEYPSLAKLEGQIFPSPLSKNEGISEQASLAIAEVALQTEENATKSKVVGNITEGASNKTPSQTKANVVAFTDSDAETLNIQFNLESRLASQLKAAKSLYTQGKKNTAIQQLNDLLSRHENNWPIQKALLKILLKEQRWQDGEALIRKLQKPNLQRLASAQLLQAQGRNQDALDLLSSELPKLAAMPDYYQNMATLSQRLEQFSKAERIYKQLLLIDNQNGAYWLGLASAQDALESPRAVSSYWRARQFNSKHKNVLNYINQRIRSLSKKPNNAALAVREEGLPI